MTKTDLANGVAVWYNLPSTVVWIELGKRWAHGLLKGNAVERWLKIAIFNTIAPGLGTGMSIVVEYYRGKAKKYIGPNGIWIAMRPMNPVDKKLPLAYAMKRTPQNAGGDLLPGQH